MRTIHAGLGVALLLAVGGPSAAAAVADAAPWSVPASFVADTSPDGSNDVAARVAVAADGAAVVAYRRSTGTRRRRPVQAFAGQRRHDLRARVGDRTGRFGAATVLTRAAVSSYSVAVRPGGDRLVAWTGPSGLRAALYRRGRWTTRTLSTGTQSEIGDVQVAVDPRGGWVMVVRQFVSPGVRVQALDLADDGNRVGPVHELGAGDFGAEARPVFALAVDRDGTAFFTYRDNQADPANPQMPPRSQIRARPHGGQWGSAVGIDGVVDARVTAAPDGGAVLAGTRPRSRGDAGYFGAPLSALVGRDGSVGPLLGPALASPGRAFGPSAVALGDGRRLLVASLKSGSAAFSRIAPVAATVLGPGSPASSLLTTGLASEPVAVPLAGQRALVLWAGERGWGGALATSSGSVGAIRPPPGPPPAPFHNNPTNRDVRSGGRYVAIAWERDGRIRVTLRRF